jgi:hypothetical protein
MITVLYIAAGVIAAVGSIFFAWRNREFCKFLAGAFFVSSGVLFYLYLADVSVPLLGTLAIRVRKIDSASGANAQRRFQQSIRSDSIVANFYSTASPATQCPPKDGVSNRPASLWIAEN